MASSTVTQTSILGRDICTDSIPDWHRLDDLSQKIWLSHAREKLRVLIGMFRPRIVILSYDDPFHALLTTYQNECSLEHGKILVVHEAEAVQ